MRLLALAALLTLALGAPPCAWASSGHSKAATTKPAKKDDGGLFASSDNVVPLPVIIAPVVYNDRLVSHLYMYLAAVTPSAAEAGKVKEKMPYILDALILNAYRGIPTVGARDAEPHYAEIVARMKTIINSIMGRDVVTELKVGRIDTAPY